MENNQQNKCECACNQDGFCLKCHMNTRHSCICSHTPDSQQIVMCSCGKKYELPNRGVCEDCILKIPTLFRTPPDPHDCDQNIESNMIPAHCRVCKKEISDRQDEWEEEFDKRATFGYLGKDSLTIGCWECGESIHRENIKSFIRTLLADQQDRYIELVEGMKEKRYSDWTGKADEDSPRYKMGYNQALTDILEKLKENK